MGTFSPFSCSYGTASTSYSTRRRRRSHRRKEAALVERNIEQVKTELPTQDIYKNK